MEETATSTETALAPANATTIPLPAADDSTSAADEGGSADAADATQPTVIVMHASVGSGHRTAAQAVKQAFELLRDTDDEALREGLAVPENLRVEFVDILDWGRVKIDGDATASMFVGFTRPFYDITWRYTLTGRLLWGGGTVWSHVMFPRFTAFVRETKPLAIVCTHITAANVAVGARMLTDGRFPIVCVPTDYETEGLWPHLHADLFCVANEHMAETLRARKLPEKRILITGIPTRPAFRQTYDRAEVRERMGLPQDVRVVLVQAGAKLPRPYLRFRAAIDEALPYLHTVEHLHLAIVAGADAEYARHLRDQCAALGLSNVTVFDYVEDMAALMAASDVAVCKSGGLTVTECLCARVPMVLLGKAYGQENINVRMLTSMGAAMHVTTSRELIDALRRIDSNPAVANAMLTNGAFLRRPDAALDVARAALRLAEAEVAADDPVRRKRFLHFYWGKKPAHTR